MAGFKINKQTVLFMSAVLVLICIYAYHFSDIPFIRMDDGWLLQAPRMLAENYTLAAPMLENGWNQTNYWHQHPPFYYVCLALFFKIFGFGVVQARLFSLILAIASGYAFAWLIKNLDIDKKINLALPVILLFTTPLFYVLAKSIRPEMLFLLLSLLSFIFLMKWSANQRFIDLVFGALTSGLLCLVHYYALHILVLWLIVIIRAKRVKPLLLWCGVIGIVFLPYILWVSSDFKAFEDQVLVARGLSTFHVVSRLLGILKYFFLSKQTVLIAMAFLAGIAIQLCYYRHRRDFQYKLVLLTPILFILQFLLLPRINYLYAIAMVPFIYLFFLMAANDGNRRTVRLVMVALIVINVSGTFTYIYKYRNYDYQAYKKQFIDTIPFSANTAVLGRASLYPIFFNTKFRAYEAFELSPDWRDRLKNVIQSSDYVVVDEFSRTNKCGGLILDDEMMNYIGSKMGLFASFTSPYYGSEGTKNNNIIEIYSNLRVSQR